MKIAIYGVSRSGKDYLLERVVNHLTTQGISAIHIKGSTILNELCYQKYGISFKQADEEKQTVLRQNFIDIVEQESLIHDVVFIDGHYSFINNMGFNTVFTDADKYCYDHFFYLDTPTEKIIEYSRQNPRRPQDLTIQHGEIDVWKKFEIKELNHVCNELHKELVILDGNTQSCIQFITDWIINFEHKFNYPNIAKQLVSQFLETNNKKHSSVLLLDCDNTLSVNDTTYEFCDILGIEKAKLKQIFWGARYSSYQFFQIKNLYSDFDNGKLQKATEYAIAQIKISDDVWNFAQNQNVQSYICLLTSGILNVWKGKSNELNSVDNVWGNDIDCKQGFFITPFLKKCIALVFQEFGIEVIAIGDSMIDIPMLEISNQGYIVAHQKFNSAVSRYFLDTPNYKISQIFATECLYPIKQIKNIGSKI